MTWRKRRQKSLKTIGYIRVSSDKQDVQNQRNEILEYVNERRLRVDEWIEVEMSAQKSLRARHIDELNKKLNEGDTVIVSELSRIGRSLVEVIQLVNKLIARKIRLIAIKQHININSKMDMQTKMMVSIFSLFSEIESDIISERTRQALAAKKAGGMILGKPKGTIQSSKLDEKRDVILELLSKSIGISGIARVVGCSRQALDEYLKKRVSFLNETKLIKAVHERYAASTMEIRKAHHKKKAAIEADTGEKMSQVEEKRLWDAESSDKMESAETEAGKQIKAAKLKNPKIAEIERRFAEKLARG
ncbi:MAG: recombinase family protein [Dissulfurispiraceae bacterium]